MAKAREQMAIQRAGVRPDDRKHADDEVDLTVSWWSPDIYYLFLYLTIYYLFRDLTIYCLFRDLTIYYLFRDRR